MPIYELLINYVTKMFLFLIDLNKGNLYQGQRVMYVNDDKGQRRFIYVHIEGESITISGVPLQNVPELFEDNE